MLYMEDIPPKVSLDEAVEIGKKYGAEESGKYVNGVLDSIYASIIEKQIIGSIGSDYERTGIRLRKYKV